MPPTRTPHRDFRHNETPLTQLTRRLTTPERDGTLARSIGLLPIRQAQPGGAFLASRVNNPASILHVWPMPACRTHHAWHR